MYIRSTTSDKIGFMIYKLVILYDSFIVQPISSGHHTQKTKITEAHLLSCLLTEAPHARNVIA